MVQEVEEVASPVQQETAHQANDHTPEWSLTMDEETERAVAALGVELQPFLGGSLEEREELDALVSPREASTPRRASAAVGAPPQYTPYVPGESAACQTEALKVSTASQTDEEVDIKDCCPHGARLPVHKH